MSFESDYRDLLIKQYWEKPKARAEIELQAGTWGRVYGWLSQFPESFDVDFAVGAQLDVIGRVVGVPRSVPEALPKVFFGFDGYDDVQGFASKFDALRESAPFASKFAPAYTAFQLNDNDYRLFIKAKIAKNNASAYMVSDDRITVQDAVNATFGGLAYIVDNKDMTATVYISPSYDLDRLRLIRQLDLIPRGMGVGVAFIVQAEPGITFGFDRNPNSMGFSSKFDSTREGGIFARKVI